MKLSEIAFVLTGATTLFVHVRNSIPMIRARRRIKKAIREKGGDSKLWGMGFDFLVVDDPSSILSGSDDTELRNLKVEFINKWNASIRGYRFTLIWLACGIAITLVIGILESLFWGG